MREMNCMVCDATMEPTYEPYELRCPCCGFWFDTWTGKEINPYGDCDEALARRIDDTLYVTAPWQRFPDYSLGGLDVWVGDDQEAPDVTAWMQGM